MPNLYTRPKPLVMIFMDGVGIAPPGPGNAVSLANTPNLDKLWPAYPHSSLYAAGLSVGLPQGVDGNSEVGHMNLGAGKVVLQELPRIDNSIEAGSFFTNQILINAIQRSKTNDVHIMGLLSSGQVHASYGHLLALIELVGKLKANPDRVFYHMFTDGRDSPPQGALKMFDRLQNDLSHYRAGKLASIVGRYYAMDRDERWERTRQAYELLTLGKGKAVKNWKEALDISYKQGKFDEYLEPYVITEGGKPVATVKSGDAVIFYNYRADRAVQITRAFEDEQFPGWDRTILPGINFIGMTTYEKGFPHQQAFPPERIDNPLGRVFSINGLEQLRIAESEKFPHVTYFFNGGNHTQYPGEDRIEVPSPRDVATYDLKPEMSSILVTEIALQKIRQNLYDVIVINYANADMVGHTGVIPATAKGMETIDLCIGKLYNEVVAKGGALVITSDHGNAEEMIDLQTGNIDTKHSTNPVPVIIAKKDLLPVELSVGILADVAPTTLALLGIPKPPEMNGRNLLI
jgi:2,3-bisphosphoglycerate-independent phosphoglycerate mutase